MKKSLPKFAYYPFGGGARSCVGGLFAWMEGVVLLLTLISKNWNVIHLLDHKVERLPRITLCPKFGMKMRLEKKSLRDCVSLELSAPHAGRFYCVELSTFSVIE
ncbi:MAG TPA: cytochrome P450 [Nitrososphaerales archaeon]|nr:cytochrome P450 [Nitrososphaerales archaeon]